MIPEKSLSQKCIEISKIENRPNAQTTKMLPNEQLAFAVFLVLEIGRHWQDIEHGLNDIENLAKQGVDINRAFEIASIIGFVTTNDTR